MTLTRPTLRCLREGLRLPLPTARFPLDEIDHPILRKAAEQFAAPDIAHERIVSIDDVVLFKVKTGRWRGAVFPEESGDDAQDWLVAAGIREEGAPDDFYAALHAQSRAARQRYNAEHDKATHPGFRSPGAQPRTAAACSPRVRSHDKPGNPRLLTAAVRVC